MRPCTLIIEPHFVYNMIEVAVEVAFDFKVYPRILNLKLLMCPLSEKMTKN